MINRFIVTFSIPVMLMNIGATIIGGIWLAILGQWELIGIGIGLLFTSHWTISIFMIPHLPIAGIAAYFYKKNSFLAPVFGYISQLYINLLIVASCGLAIVVCLYYHKGEIGIDSTPYLLWSWGMALGGWQFLASKDQENEFSAIAVLNASVFYFLILVSYFISPVVTLTLSLIFGFVQLVALPIYNLYVANKIDYIDDI